MLTGELLNMEFRNSKEENLRDTYYYSIWIIFDSAVSTRENGRTFLCVIRPVVIDVNTIDTNCVNAVDISIECAFVIKN